MTIYDLIYQTCAQKVEDDYLKPIFVCSTCGYRVEPEDIKCPCCRRFFISQDEIDDMIAELVRRISDVIIKNVRGE